MALEELWRSKKKEPSTMKTCWWKKFSWWLRLKESVIELPKFIESPKCWNKQKYQSYKVATKEVKKVGPYSKQKAKSYTVVERGERDS